MSKAQPLDITFLIIWGLAIFMIGTSIEVFATIGEWLICLSVATIGFMFANYICDVKNANTNTK